MAKRFTDSNKWRNEWFRTLPIQAKLTWTYLCDECESHGVIKLDFGLASFQLGFDITPTVLQQWFGKKLHFFGDDKILIIQFFEFQYGESKNTWSAKIEATKKLELLGFSIENNKIVIPIELNSTKVDPQWCESVPTPLIIGIGKGIVNKKEKRTDFFQILDSTEAGHIPLKFPNEFQEILKTLGSEHVFGDKFPVLLKKTTHTFCAILLSVYDCDVTDFKEHLQAIINENLSDEKKGLDRKEYILTRIKNKALELHNATH